MADFLHSFGLTPSAWFLIALCVTFMGANKTGIVGINLIAIPILATIFGGKASTGILLPFMVMADLFAIISYRNSIRWKELFLLIPWTLLGITAGLIIGQHSSDETFKIFIAIVIVILLILLLLSEVFKIHIVNGKHWYVPILIGTVGGFVSMIGNAASPIVSIYFIALHLSKREYIASRAWFFWIVNVIKIPLHVFIWHTITLRTFLFNLTLSPLIVIGAVAGLLIVHKIPERPYKILIIATTFFSAILMIV